MIRYQPRFFLLGVLVLFALTQLISCASIGRKLAEGYATSKVQKIKFPDVRGIANCVKTDGGICESCKKDNNLISSNSEIRINESRNAIITLNENIKKEPKNDRQRFLNVQDKFTLLYEYLTYPDDADSLNLAGAGSDGKLDLNFNPELLQGYINYIQQDLTFGGTEVLSFNLSDSNGNVLFGSNDEEIVLLLKSYFTEYFRKGKFVKATINLSELIEELKRKLQEKYPGIQIPSDAEPEKLLEFLASYFPELPAINVEGEKFTFGEVAEISFITRSGSKYQFPPLEFNVSPTADKPFTYSEVDFTSIGSDLIRVTIEALGDGLAQLPTVTNATGSKTLRHSKDPGNKETVLKVFNKDDEDYRACMDDEDFGRVNEIANMLEGVTSTAAGQILRGAGPFSLDNEALAKLLETLIGVVVRKATEKVAWCATACINLANSESLDIATRSGQPESLFILQNMGKDPNAVVDSLSREDSVNTRYPPKIAKISFNY